MSSRLVTFSSKLCQRCKLRVDFNTHVKSRSNQPIFCRTVSGSLQNNRIDTASGEGNNGKPTHFITTPIFYVNAAPHIGHLYTATLADAIHRWKKICGFDSQYSTGTDEHGLKIQQAALQSKKLPIDLCDEVSAKFKDLFKLANVEYTDFVRTTEDRHVKAVQHFWKILEERGYIYKGTYEGWYSVSDEAFVPESQVKDHIKSDGSVIKITAESNQPVTRVTEENYMFRLSEFGPQLTDWLNKKVIKPLHFETVVRNWIAAGLQDLSVSRQHDRLQWGIPVPGDHTQTIYVWLDALVNYLTVTGYPNESHYWPADSHVVGKDILKFHAIYWPSFLMAAGLNPPKHIFCHSHWTVDNVKMSKSLGNVVNPLDSISRFTVDGLRYFLLHEGVPQHDGNFSEESIYNLVNSDLGNTLGNLLNRCTSVALNPDQTYPPMHCEEWNKHADQQDKDFIERLQLLPDAVNQHYLEFNIYRAIDTIMEQLRYANAFVQRHKPWELKNDLKSRAWLECIVHVTMETLRVTGILLQPVIPTVSRKLLTKLSIGDSEQFFDNLDSFHFLKGQKSPYANKKLHLDKCALFPKIKH